MLEFKEALTSQNRMQMKTKTAEIVHMKPQP